MEGVNANGGVDAGANAGAGAGVNAVAVNAAGAARNTGERRQSGPKTKVRCWSGPDHAA